MSKNYFDKYKTHDKTKGMCYYDETLGIQVHKYPMDTRLCYCHEEKTEGGYVSGTEYFRGHKKDRAKNLKGDDLKRELEKVVIKDEG